MLDETVRSGLVWVSESLCRSLWYTRTIAIIVDFWFVFGKTVGKFWMNPTGWVELIRMLEVVKSSLDVKGHLKTPLVHTIIQRPGQEPRKPQFEVICSCLCFSSWSPGLFTGNDPASGSGKDA